MKARKITKYLFAKFTRALPPPLAYRLDFSASERIYRGSKNLFGRSLFGKHVLDCDMQDVVQKNFFLHGSNAFYPMVLASQIVDDDDIVFEIGANVGTETLSFSYLVRHGGKVIAVEPSERNKNRLDQALDLNSINNVITIKAAVDSETGVLSFKHGRDDNSGIGHLEQICSSSRSSELVDVLTLDSLLQYGNPKLIFMDIEGHELRALTGAFSILNESRPYIIFELNTTLLARSGSCYNDLLEILDNHGYQCFDFGQKLAPIDRDFVGNIDTDYLAVPNERVSGVPKLRRRQLLTRFIPSVLGV